MFSSRSWSTELVGSVLALALSSGISGCTAPQPEEPSLAQDPSALSGEFVTYVADFEDGHSERWHALKQADGRELRLDFDAVPPFSTGRKIWVRGNMLSEKRMQVTAFEGSPELARAGGALTGDDPEVIAAPAMETYAIVLVDTGAGVNLTAAAAQARLNSATPADRSFANYYGESSYGKYGLTPASTVLGPFPFTLATCDTSGMASAIEGMLGAATVAQYQHLIYYFNRTATCAFGGLGEEGSSSRPSKRTWMNGSLTCVVLMQEPGHNLGLMHANTMNCNGQTFSATPASCTITEYGSQLSTMGGGCRVLNGYEKWYSQWFAGCNGVTVKGNGDFNLLPIETPCNGGIQTLQVPFPAALIVSDPQSTNTMVSLRNFYLELRTASGNYDTYAAAGGGGGGRVTFSAPTVFLYTSDNVRPPPTTTTGRGQSSVWTELLNTTPTGTAFTGFTAAGQSFTDPASGMVITLKSISATSATVTVSNNPTAGSATCIDGTTLAGGGPATCGGPVTGGSAGSSGAAGATGAAGAAGTAGAPGTGGRGAGGMTGTVGTGGARGQGGTTGTTGTGGATGGGTGGAPGGNDGVGGKITPTPDGGPGLGGEVTGGCGCNVPTGTGTLWSGLLGTIALVLLRRRRR